MITRSALQWSPGAAGPLLGDEPEEPHWSEAASCAQADPDAFFPEPGDLATEAKAICARCPVRAECLEEALENDVRFGVWGGTTEADRKRMRRAARSPQELAA